MKASLFNCVEKRNLLHSFNTLIVLILYIMKTNIYKFFLFTAIAVVAFFNFNSNAKLNSSDTNLILTQQAQANVTECTGWASGVNCCCNDYKEGHCGVLNSTKWDGPYCSE